jgi:hypothetical protein
MAYLGVGVKSVTVSVRANMPPCSHCNTSFVSLMERHFGLAPPTRPVQVCKNRGGIISISNQF